MLVNSSDLWNICLIFRDNVCICLGVLSYSRMLVKKNICLIFLDGLSSLSSLEGILSQLIETPSCTVLKSFIEDFCFGKMWYEILGWLSCLPGNWPLILKLTNYHSGKDIIAEGLYGKNNVAWYARKGDLSKGWLFWDGH